MSGTVLAFTIVSLLVLILLLLRGRIEHRLIYVPEKELLVTPAQVGLAAEDVWLQTEDGLRLHAWWFPSPQSRGTVIVCHGNKGNMGGRLWMAEDFLKWKLDVLLFDYRGYGHSEGRASAKGTREDVLAAYRFVIKTTGSLDQHPIIGFGRSLGGAVVLQLAAERQLSGLIVESTFTSTLDMGERFHKYLLPRYTLTNLYDNLGKVGGLTMPKIFAHGREDTRIPFDMGQKLFEAAGAPKQFVELQGSHVASNWRTTPAYHAMVSTFLDDLLGPVKTS